MTQGAEAFISTSGLLWTMFSALAIVDVQLRSVTIVFWIGVCGFSLWVMGECVAR